MSTLGDSDLRVALLSLSAYYSNYIASFYFTWQCYICIKFARSELLRSTLLFLAAPHLLFCLPGHLTHCELLTMSTGAPSLGVDTHTHGHSRSHGHSRTNRWAQPPLLPQPTEAHLHVTPEPVDTLGSRHSYQHTHHDPGHNNYTHAHSHGVAHHTHDHNSSSAYHHHDEDQNALGHDTKLSNGACGTMLADASRKADQSSEKKYVNRDLLEEKALIIPTVMSFWPVRLSYCHGLRSLGIRDKASKEKIPRVRISLRTYWLHPVCTSTKRHVF